MRGPFRTLGAAALLAGCSGANAGQSDPQACAPVESPEPVEQAAGLAGAHTVRLVATSGPKRGSAVEGRLELTQRDSASGTIEGQGGGEDTPFSFPLMGTADVDFAAVGATIPGDAASSDPQSPGVLVIERPGGVMLRLGSEANRPGVRRYDGGYTVLQVQQVTEAGFAGTWRSAVGLEEAGGHFCAVRTT